jgi:hypothetical protein
MLLFKRQEMERKLDSRNRRNRFLQKWYVDDLYLMAWMSHRVKRQACFVVAVVMHLNIGLGRRARLTTDVVCTCMYVCLLIVGYEECEVESPTRDLYSS